MKNLIRSCVGFILAFFSFILQAQTQYATLEKNRNIQAKSLSHELNATGDTLVLKSEYKIDYLYSINKNSSQDLKVDIDSTAYKIPLNRFKKGRHVMVAVQSPKRFVFVVNILKEIPVPIKKVIALREPTPSRAIQVTERN